MEISLDGNPGIEVELEPSSRRLRERYYIGGRKDFGNIVVYPQLASPSSLTRTEFLFGCVYCDTRNNLTFHSTSHRSPWITGKPEVIKMPELAEPRSYRPWLYYNWLGHESLATTQKYLEPSKETEKQLEEMKLPF